MFRTCVFLYGSVHSDKFLGQEEPKERKKEKILNQVMNLTVKKLNKQENFRQDGILYSMG